MGKQYSTISGSFFANKNGKTIEMDILSRLTI
jgi:hypothetical protein